MKEAKGLWAEIQAQDNPPYDAEKGWDAFVKYCNENLFTGQYGGLYLWPSQIKALEDVSS